MRHLIAWFALLPVMAFAQAPQSGWKPSRPVEFIVSAAPGGANDRLARAIQRIVQESQLAPVPMNVVSKPGGGGSIAIVYVNTHAGDAHYITLASSAWMSTVAGGRGTVTHRDVTPIVKLLDEPIVYFANAGATLKSARDIAERLRKSPASLSFGLSVAAGNPLHLSLVNIARHSGADPTQLKVVVFNSGSETATQVSGGHVDVGVSSPGSALPLTQSGKLRLLAVASAQRLDGTLSNLPTLREQGIDVAATAFYVMLAPKGATPAQIAYWEDVFAKVVRSPEFRKDLAANYWTADFMGPHDAAEFMEQKYQDFRRALLEIGMAK
jgi:putative tricarboxylic transport membrane protein